MRAPFAALFCLCLTLASCGRVNEAESAAGRAAETAEQAAEDTVAEPSPAEAEFVGVWAPSAEQCGQGETWRITPERLATGAGVSCAIEGAARSGPGWTLQAQCTARGGAAAASVLTLTPDPTPPSTSMTVTGGPFGTPATVVRCTPPLSAAPAD